MHGATMSISVMDRINTVQTKKQQIYNKIVEYNINFLTYRLLAIYAINEIANTYNSCYICLHSSFETRYCR